MEEMRRSMVKPTFKSSEVFTTDDDSVVALEIKMSKTRITDDVPFHFANSILQWSKVLFYRYVKYDMLLLI